MKSRFTENPKDSDKVDLAKEIFSVVRLFPPKLQLKDVSDVFDRIGKEPEKSSIGQIERLRGHWNDEPSIEIDEAAISEHEAMLFGLRTIIAIDALHECCKGLPAAVTDRLDITPLDNEQIYRLLRLNTWMDESFEAFLERGKKDKEWFLAASDYAQVLDACERYSTMRSWYERLYTLALIGGPFFRHNADAVSRLLPLNSVFVFKQLTVRDGRISSEPDDFTKAFYNVEIDRVRICGACKKVFWATRMDMKGCTVPCAKVLRTRKWRSKPGNRLEEKYRNYKRVSKEKQ